MEGDGVVQGVDGEVAVQGDGEGAGGVFRMSRWGTGTGGEEDEKELGEQGGARLAVGRVGWGFLTEEGEAGVESLQRRGDVVGV